MRPYVVHWLAGYMHRDVASVLAPSWFTCVGLAGLVGLIVMLVLARRRGIESGTVASAMTWGYIAAVGAGIAMPMLIDAVEHLIATGHVELRWAGMTSFWGYLAGAAAVAGVCKRDGVPLARFGDLAAIPLGVALVFARLGCFMAGCDYGKVSALPWAVRFPAGSPAWRDQVQAGLIPSHAPTSLAVHPTQLYEALLGVVIVVVVVVVARRARTDGKLFLAAAATYAIGRLAIETLRGDAGRGIYAGVSSGQLFSLLVLGAIAARHVVAKRRMVTAIATCALVLAVGNVAEAQPLPRDLRPVTEPPDNQPDDPPPVPDTPPPAPPAPPPTVDFAHLRPVFAIGVLMGGAVAMNRSSEQVPALGGGSLSFGYIPGRFGLWLDLDSYANSEASHDSAIASVSFAPRITPRLWLGARAGLGVTHVTFKDPLFHDVAGQTVRIEAIGEIVLGRQWVVWVRPLTIDVVESGELGGALTTYQFRAGVAFRFGARRTPPPPPPPSWPTLAGQP
jgi:prolipoprotein diacylglyceryltransferase